MTKVGLSKFRQLVLVLRAWARVGRNPVTLHKMTIARHAFSTVFGGWPKRSPLALGSLFLYDLCDLFRDRLGEARGRDHPRGSRGHSTTFLIVFDVISANRYPKAGSGECGCVGVIPAAPTERIIMTKNVLRLGLVLAICGALMACKKTAEESAEVADEAAAEAAEEAVVAGEAAEEAVEEAVEAAEAAGDAAEAADAADEVAAEEAAEEPEKEAAE